MTAKEYLKQKNTLWNELTESQVCEIIDIMQDFAQIKCKEQKEKDKLFILPLCKKFIDKVDTGRARSKETYKDMKDIVNYLNSPEPKI